MSSDAPDYGEPVRETWTAWAAEQYPVKSSWVLPWAEIDEGQREVDRRIGTAVAAAERARIYAELGNDHFVIFTEDRWTVEHSVECRLSGQMPECAYHEAIADIAADGPDPEMMGRWLISEIDSAGLPSLTRASGGDGPVRPQDGPRTAGQGRAGVTGYREP